MDEQPRHHRRRRGLLALLMAGTALISATGAVMSLALFTDSTAWGANTFTTGTVHIGITPTPVNMTAAAMMPGDTVNGSVVVANTGTAQMRYAVSGLATNTDGKNLTSQLTVTIRTADNPGPGNTCTNFTGTQLYSGSLGVVEGNVIGTFGTHPNGGRTLASGNNETLCFRVNLPLATGNAFEGATTTMTFTFYAEQTANN